MQELAYDERTLSRLWGEVKATFQEDLPASCRRLVKTLLETTMEGELEQVVGVRWHERSLGRQDYRNGSYRRDLTTELGLLRHLRVPRTRRGGYRPQVFARYQRRQPQVNRVLRHCWLAGVSTRRVGQVLAPLLGEAVSAQTISRVTQVLSAEVARFHTRPLQDRYRYLLVDGIVLTVMRTCLGTVKRVALCAYGITAQGQRELMDFWLVKSESEAHWTRFLTGLSQRGLTGDALRLMVSDGSPGLAAALDLVYPRVPRQRCWVHKLRNVAAKLPRAIQAACLAGAKRIYLAESATKARWRFQEWAAAWRLVAPKAVACVERDLEALLAFFSCPQEHWRMVRTTNAIERAFREVRRRTRPMSVMQDPRSCERIIYAIVHYLNTQWERTPCRGVQEITQNS